MRTRRLALVAVLAALIAAVAPDPAGAIPALQLYIEGANYDSTTQSWVFVGDIGVLWVLGNVGQVGPITDVRLTAAFPSGLTGTISLTGTTATSGMLPAPGDPSQPPDPPPVPDPSSAFSPDSPCGPNGTDGTIPCMSDSKTLPSHGQYGAGIQWREFDLGDFTLTDSPIGDFIDAFPSTFPSMGQINAYRFEISGFPPGTVIHFDAFDGIVSGNKVRSVFAPFSHDVVDQPERPVPGPTGLLVVALGLGGFTVRAWTRRPMPRRRAPRTRR
jgi:hypothetical protein